MLESRGPKEQVRASLYQEVGAERFACENLPGPRFSAGVESVQDPAIRCPRGFSDLAPNARKN